MSKIPVDDFGLEVIRKAAEESSDLTKYNLRTVISDSINIPINAEQVSDILMLLESIKSELQKITIHLQEASGIENTEIN